MANPIMTKGQLKQHEASESPQKEKREDAMEAKGKMDPADAPEESAEAMYGEQGADRTITSESPGLQKLAKAGRFGDTEIAHTTPDEIIIPLDIQDEETMAFLAQKFAEYGIPMEKYVVGNESRESNPATGDEEYFSLGGIFKSIIPAAVGMIPGVGQIAGPLVGAAMNGMGGSSGGGAASAGGANLSSLPPPVQAGIANKPAVSPFRKSTVFTLDDNNDVNNSFGEKPTPPLAQDIPPLSTNPVSGNSRNPSTGMGEYYSGTNSKPSAPPLRRGNRGNMGGIPSLRARPSMNPKTGRPEYAGGTVATNTPVIVGQKGQAAPNVNSTYNNDYVKPGLVDLSPFTNSGIPAVKGANASSVAVPYPKAEATPAAAPAPTPTPAASPTPTPTPAPSASPYVNEQYYGAGRNEREQAIQGLGYTGPFGQGAADGWLKSKFGTANLDEIPRMSTQTTANNTTAAAAPNPFQESMDKLNALIEKYLNPTVAATPTPTPAQSTGGATPSGLSPYRPPRFRSRKYTGTYASNF